MSRAPLADEDRGGEGVVAGAALAALLLVVLAAGSRADTVQLKNGRELEGVIAGETPTQVELDFGFGTTVLQRSDIADIRRSSAAAKEELLEKNKLRSFEAGVAAPPGAEEVARALSDARRAREASFDAHRASKESRAALIRLQAEVGATSQRLQTLVSRPARLHRQCVPSGCPKSPLICRSIDLDKKEKDAEKDRLRGLVTSLRAERDRVLREIAATQPPVTGYQSALRNLRALADKKLPVLCSPPAAKEVDAFCSQTEASIADMSRDFQRFSIPFRREHSRITVDAVGAGQNQVAFVLEPDVVTTVIPESLADPMGAQEIAGADGMEVVLPGSGSRTVRPAVLSRLSLGQATMESVPVGIWPLRDSGSPVVGRLGKTFLMDFQIEIDEARGKVDLERLAPTE